MDKYTRIALTVIAITLMFIASGGKITFPSQAQAGGNAAGFLTHLEPDHDGGVFIQWGRSVYHCNTKKCVEIAVLNPKS